MLQNTFKRNSFNVIPFYKGITLGAEEGVVWLEDHDREEKIRLIKNLYRFAKDIDDSIDDLMLFENDSLNDCILLLSRFIVKKDNTYEIDVANVFVIGLDAGNEYDSGSIPIKAFIKERKDEEFTDFLLKILANLDWCGHSLFDNYIHESCMEMAYEIYWEVQDPKSDYAFEDHSNDYFAYKIYTKIIRPYLKRIPKGNYFEFDDKYVKKMVKKHPKWKEFIYDALDSFNSGCKFNDMVPLNVSDEDRQETYLALQDLFHFRYEYDTDLEGSAYDSYIYYNMDQMGQNMITERAYSVLLYRPGVEISKQAIESRKERINKLTKLYFKQYDCFTN